MPTDDWLDIPNFETEIAGESGSRILFVTTSVLDKRIVRYGAVCFNVTLTLRTSRDTFSQSFGFADYGGLRPFHAGLKSIRNGTGNSASLVAQGLSLTVEFHTSGVHQGVVVHGYYSSILGTKGGSNFFPWPTRKHIGDLVLDGPDEACLRFAFRLADQTHLDNTIRQIDEILRYLAEQGFEA